MLVKLTPDVLKSNQVVFKGLSLPDDEVRYMADHKAEQYSYNPQSPDTVTFWTRSGHMVGVGYDGRTMLVFDGLTSIRSADRINHHFRWLSELNLSVGNDGPAGPACIGPDRTDDITIRLATITYWVQMISRKSNQFTIAIGSDTMEYQFLPNTFGEDEVKVNGVHVGNRSGGVDHLVKTLQAKKVKIVNE